MSEYNIKRNDASTKPHHGPKISPRPTPANATGPTGTADPYPLRIIRGRRGSLPSLNLTSPALAGFAHHRILRRAPPRPARQAFWAEQCKAVRAVTARGVEWMDDRETAVTVMGPCDVVRETLLPLLLLLLATRRAVRWLVSQWER